MGKEHVGKGVNVALGPMMNMGRIAQGGRNWEGFGADPFLAGEAAYETVLGMQQAGVQACAKHLINKYVFLPCTIISQSFHTSSVSRNINGLCQPRMWTTVLNMKYMHILSCGASWPEYHL